MATETQQTAPGRRFNLWKVGFFIALFVALFAVEIAREIAAVAGTEKPLMMTKAMVIETGRGRAVAEGRWVRTDGGDELTPRLVRIECDVERGECTEVAVKVIGPTVWAPDMQTFKAEFTTDAITYEDRSPQCNQHFTRVDLRLKKVMTVREPKTNRSKVCEDVDQHRIEMQLGDGWWDMPRYLNEGHFVPLLRLWADVEKLFR